MQLKKTLGEKRPKRKLYMKFEEELAFRYLSTLGVPDYEPNGNRPPDFSLPGNRAIEVRRLNQNKFTENKTEGLENASFTIEGALQESIDNINKGSLNGRYLITIRYQRPFLLKRRILAKYFENVFRDELIKPGPFPREIKVADNIWIVIYETKSLTNKTLSWAATSDWDSGGFLVQLYIDNISHCISDKTTKVQPYRDEYKYWWLFLVDFIGLTPSVISDIQNSIKIQPPFDRISVLDPVNNKLVFDWI